MTRKERYEAVATAFSERMPHPTTELNFGSTFQLLVAVVLSAQCTDKRVNEVTPQLFSRYPTPQAMAKATADDLLDYIGSVSYPNAKAQHLVEMAQTLVEKFDGNVPDDMDSLTQLKGVGRKTANVIMAVAFGKHTIAVDTHVYRVSHRLGLVSPKDNTPFKVEQQLMKNFPQQHLANAHHWLLLHGRYVCTARSPHCDKCFLKQVCKENAHLADSPTKKVKNIGK